MANLLGTSGNDVLSGTSGSDTISDGAGDDYVAAGAGNDTITGGTGNDWYEAGAGVDTLVLSSGFGNDIVDLFTNSGGPPYADNFQIANIFDEDLFGYRTGDQLGVANMAGTDNISFLDFFSVTPAPFGSFSAPLKAGGTQVYTPTSDNDGDGIPDIQELPLLTFGTDGNDSITTTNVGNFDNYAWGGLGNDSLTSTGNFAMLFGGGGNDTLTAGSGTNGAYLVGGAGADTYVVGSGQSAFIDDMGSSSGDTLIATSLGFNDPNTYAATIDNRHLMVYNAVTGTTIFIIDWQSTANQIESVQLSDGTYSYAFIAANIFSSPNYLGNFTWESATNNAITTADFNTAIAKVQALAGNDQGPTLGLTIGGTSASETLTGFSGDNTLVGDAGNDTLRGMGGNDQYVFRPGDGQDTVDNITGASIGETNMLRFGAGVRAGQLFAAQSGGNLVLNYSQTGSDRVTLTGWYGTSSALARQVEIGTSDAPVMQLVGPGTAGTSAAEMFIGTTGNDTIDSGGGADWITPSGGNDVVNGGTGLQTVVLAGPRASYSVARNGATVTVTDLDGSANGGNDGTDTLTSIERLKFSDTTVSLVPRNDFNGDGSSDLFWQNANGALAQWQQNGTAYVGGGVFAGAPSGWSIAAEADFNGDGKADILWQNTNGSLGEWQMDGTSYIGGGVIAGPPAGWSLAAVADFNGDGKADILWQNTNGSLGEWQMDGTNYIGGGVIAGPPAGWSLAAVADFNGDGKADLLWQNTNGALAEWQMDGTSYIGGGVFAGAPAGWTLKGVADFTGDGKADLLWQNGNALGEWYMDGTNYIGGGVFSAAGGTWSIAGLSDFNGDAKTDILWSDSAGNLAQWQMNGTSYVGGGVFGPKPAGWNLVNTGQLIG